MITYVTAFLFLLSVFIVYHLAKMEGYQEAKKEKKKDKE